jgi:hypothetical protein
MNDPIAAMSWRRYVMFWLAAVVFLTVAMQTASSSAHGGDTSYVVLTPNGTSLDGSVSLDLIDAAGVLRVPQTDLAEGRRSEVVADYLVAHLSLFAEKEPCPIEPVRESMAVDPKTGRLVMKFAAHCARAPEQLDVRFTIFFDVMGPSYLGIVSLAGDNPATLMFTKRQTLGALTLARFDGGQSSAPAAPRLDDASGGSSAAPVGEGPRKNAGSRWSWLGLTSAIRIGILHIWSCADHMLFLLALLMTSVLERTGTGPGAAWRPRASLRAALIDVAKIVTGFTVTHSVTLSLAALGLLRPASRVIEPAIAASVAVAALDNLRPFLRGRKWVIASTLGLLHGFGFASALNELALPHEALLVTLCGFAMGVETGQFIFVSAFVPLAFLLRRTRFYERWIVRGGSVAIGLVALVWMVERALPRR